MKLLAAVAFLSAVALPGALAVAPAKTGAVARPAAARPAARDWVRVVNRTPAGTYVIGNPAAKVKLVEYLSLTCPHCGHFASEAYPALEANYIRPGLVSLEVRHAVRDPFDLTASVLIRCGGPGTYLAALKAAFAAQADWAVKGEAYADKAGAALEKKPVAEQLLALSGGTGLDALFAARGLPVARQTACLTNAAERTALSAQANEAWRQRKIPGTPAFLINGTLAADKIAWPELEPAIKAALR